MKKKEQILRAFAMEKLEAQGWESNENILDAIISFVRLEEGTPSIQQETRTATVTEDTDGKLTAKSIKLYNIVKVKNYDLLGFAIKQNAALLTEDDRLKVFFTILNLLHEFYSKLTYPFNEQDAKILLLIYLEKGKHFDLAKIVSAYNKKFEPTLAEEKILNSLQHFVKMKVIEVNKEGMYHAVETIIHERTYN